MVSKWSINVGKMTRVDTIVVIDSVRLVVLICMHVYIGFECYIQASSAADFDWNFDISFLYDRDGEV